MKFDQNGNLVETIVLSYGKFKKEFGFNEIRKSRIKTLLLFLRIFRSLGCTNVYVVGSMVSDKQFPGDIDICIDATHIDYRKLLKEYPEFLESSGIAAIQREHKVHFAAFFDAGSHEILSWFRKDRDGNPRGLVKIFLNDIEAYDQKRKTI
jgi:predicted nucleotidyltransferase